MRIGNLIIFEKETEDRDETLIQFDKEARKRKLMKPINAIGDTIKAAIKWAKEHPGEAITICVAVGSGVYKVIRIIVRDREVRLEKFNTDCRFYDPRIGEYVCSKRKLTNNEKLRFNDLYNSGKTKREALNIMGLIKD